jgi:hypothetical protein
MPDVMEAQRAYRDAPDEARLLLARRRAQLGRAIATERAAGTQQEAIARRLSKTREQVRRYEAAWRDWDKDYPGESLDDD